MKKNKMRLSAMYDFNHPVKCIECIPLDKGKLYTYACIQIYMHVYMYAYICI